MRALFAAAVLAVLTAGCAESASKSTTEEPLDSGELLAEPIEWSYGYAWDIEGENALKIDIAAGEPCRFRLDYYFDGRYRSDSTWTNWSSSNSGSFYSASVAVEDLDLVVSDDVIFGPGRAFIELRRSYVDWSVNQTVVLYVKNLIAGNPDMGEASVGLDMKCDSPRNVTAYATDNVEHLVANDWGGGVSVDAAGIVTAHAMAHHSFEMLEPMEVWTIGGFLDESTFELEGSNDTVIIPFVNGQFGQSFEAGSYTASIDQSSSLIGAPVAMFVSWPEPTVISAHGI